MNTKEGINKLENEKNKTEVMLDGGDGLSAALSSGESDYPMYNIKVERGFYTVYELKRKYDRDEKRIILYNILNHHLIHNMESLVFGFQ